MLLKPEPDSFEPPHRQLLPAFHGLFRPSAPDLQPRDLSHPMPPGTNNYAFPHSFGMLPLIFWKPERLYIPKQIHIRHNLISVFIIAAQQAAGLVWKPRFGMFQHFFISYFDFLHPPNISIHSVNNMLYCTRMQ